MITAGAENSVFIQYLISQPTFFTGRSFPIKLSSYIVVSAYLYLNITNLDCKTLLHILIEAQLNVYRQCLFPCGGKEVVPCCTMQNLAAREATFQGQSDPIVFMLTSHDYLRTRFYIIYRFLYSNLVQKLQFMFYFPNYLNEYNQQAFYFQQLSPISTVFLVFSTQGEKDISLYVPYVYYPCCQAYSDSRSDLHALLFLRM